jgi:phage terminase large subunit-like protein
MSWPRNAKLKLLALRQSELWLEEARTAQLPPRGNWRAWYIRGGRGSGKTRTGAETLRDWITQHPPSDWAIIAPTDGAARKVCMEGRRSGLIKAFGGWHSPLISDYRRTDGTLTLWNGSRVLIDGADDGALRIQGENLSGAWCDEVGLWRNWDLAWNESLWPAVRIEPGLIVATGTPKMGHGLIRQLIEDENVPVTHMRTIDNVDNLPADQVAEFYRRFEGTRRGRQELEGEFLEDVEGALWTPAQLDALRVREVPELERIVVGVDPSGSSAEGANAAGIVAVGIEKRGLHAVQHMYVLEDRTLRTSPDGWAREAINVYDGLRADRIVAERNYGAEMVELTIRTIRPNVSMTTVWASRGKAIRAEPVAALYEQGKVHHVGFFHELETEMTTWTPQSKDSPNRMDALVWALTDLGLGNREGGQGSYMSQASVPVVRRGDLVLRGERYIDK